MMTRVGRGRRRSTAIGLAVLAVAFATASLSIPAGATHGDVSLAGSNFEIDRDANLKVDHGPPSLDWANVAEDRQSDGPTGQSDDSFGNGTKEDMPVPSVVDASIPNNKSDLLNFGSTSRDRAAGSSCTCSGIGCRSRPGPRTWTSSSTSRRPSAAMASRPSARPVTCS